MGYLLGVGIPVIVVGAFVALFVLSARSAKKKHGVYERFARRHRMQMLGTIHRPHLDGTISGRSLSILMGPVNLSGDPTPGGRAPGMMKVEVALRTPVPSTQRALVARPFFREAIHRPLRGGARVMSGDAAFDAAFRLFVPPNASLDWLDPATRQALLRLNARELRLDQGELSLNIAANPSSFKRLERAVTLLIDLASRV